MDKTCTTRRLYDQIHVFQFHEASIRAVDTWLAQMSAIVERDGMLGRVLIALPEEVLPPIRYSLREVRRWILHHPQTLHTTQTAVIVPYGKGLLGVLQTFQYTLTRGQPTNVRYFFCGEYDEAVAWLLDAERIPN